MANKDPPIILIGNKSDKEDKMPSLDIYEFANEHDLRPYLLSMYKPLDIDRMFVEVSQYLIDNYDYSDERLETIDLSDDKKKKKKKCCFFS